MTKNHWITVRYKRRVIGEFFKYVFWAFVLVMPFYFTLQILPVHSANEVAKTLGLVPYFRSTIKVIATEYGIMQFWLIGFYVLGILAVLTRGSKIDDIDVRKEMREDG